MMLLLVEDDSHDSAPTPKRKQRLFTKYDMGYNDLSSYGSPTISTPNIDAIASQGAKFTQFYQGAPLCTPARASMLTGRLPIRSGIYTGFEAPVDELFRVFYPTSVGCLPETEISVAKALKPKYSTSMVGKWHLGHNVDRNCLPGRGNVGFDFFYGIPYSHEEGYPGPFPESLVFPPVPLMTNGYQFIEQPFNMSDLTSRYTSVTEDLILRFGEGQQGSRGGGGGGEGGAMEPNALYEDMDFSKPFFIHVGYENPHVPLFLGDDYSGNSRRGLYGDVMQEMDLSIGRIVAALKAAGVYDNTLIAFTSDNGAWTNPSNGLNDERATKGVGPYDGGNNSPFYEGKGSTYEGGFRVPMILSLPSAIPPGQIIRSPVTAMDFFPTFLSFAGVDVPTDRVYDGVSLEKLLLSSKEVSADSTELDPHECIFLWREKDLYAIRCGQYKAHFITRSGFDFSDLGVVQDPPLLYNVEWDPGEAIPLNTSHAKNKKIVVDLQFAAARHKATIEFVPSEYTAQNLSRVPCCPRGHKDGEVHSAVLELFPGPWQQCICTRVEQEVSAV